MKRVWILTVWDYRSKCKSLDWMWANPRTYYGDVWEFFLNPKKKLVYLWHEWVSEVAQSCLTVRHYGLVRQAPLSVGFSRQEYWSGLPFSSPGDLPDPGIKLRSPALQADSLPPELPGNPYLWHASPESEQDASNFSHRFLHVYQSLCCLIDQKKKKKNLSSVKHSIYFSFTSLLFTGIWSRLMSFGLDSKGKLDPGLFYMPPWSLDQQLFKECSSLDEKWELK